MHVTRPVVQTASPCAARHDFLTCDKSFANCFSPRRPPSTYICRVLFGPFMDSAANTIRQFLIEAQRRTGCHAVAYSSPSHDAFHFHCHSEDAREVEGILRGIADTFLLQARESNN